MTKKSLTTMAAKDELDIDSFLRRHNSSSTPSATAASSTSSSSDEDVDDRVGVHRTVDDILNDSDTSDEDDVVTARYSSSQSLISRSRLSNSAQLKYNYDDNDSNDAVSSLEELKVARLDNSLIERDASEVNLSSKASKSTELKYKSDDHDTNDAGEVNLMQRLKSDGFSSRRPPAAVNSRPMSVFGNGVRSAGKPGAAFAAATAASRPIKSRRAMSLSLVGKVSDGDDLYDSPGRISSVSGDVEVSSESVADDMDNVAKNVGEFSEGSDELLVTETESVSRNHESFVLDSNVVTENEVEESLTSVLEDVERDNDTVKSVVSEFEDLETNKVVEESVKEKSGIMEFEDIGMSNEVGENGNEKFDSEHFEAEMETERAELPNLDMSLAVLDEVGAGRDDDDSSSVSDDVRDLVDELLEDKSEQLESEGAIGAKKKPLELAEELERKQASSGHDWEEGAAAQPMRLDGVVRGSSVLGYFDVSADNFISRAIKSQEFRRDYGSPQVLAVHLNYIALGMTKGVIVVVPSKYSVQHGDSVESKMLKLGAQGDRSHVPVTSMCFNQLGDLLLAGYGDGHVTLWTLPRGTVGKVITGEHKAPVVHAFFLGQDSQITRQYKAVTGDCKGVSKIHEISLTVFGFQIKTKCVFDGETTGTVLCASPLLPDELTGAASSTVPGNTTGSTSSLSGVMGGVIGGATGWKLFTEDSSLSEEAVVVFVSNLKALVVRLSPSVVVYESLLKPEGVRKGALPYTAWKCTTQLHGSSAETSNHEALEKISLLALAWDCKVQVFRLVKKDLKVCGQWTLESTAIGVAWLDDQLLVILTLAGQLCLYTRDGTLIHQTSYDINGNSGDDMIAYHTYFTNYPERAYQNSLAVRGACVYVLAPTHLVVSRLLLWKERIQVLRNAGDWMGAFNMAMTLYDGQTHGVIDLPRNLHAIQEALMPYLVELLFSYVDEVFSYISVACSNHMEKEEQVDGAINGSNSTYSEIKEQFTRVGGVAVEFCIHIKRTDILFDDIFSKFVAVQHRDTFLELLEPYILKDMLGSLPPEIMQALVEHYNFKGWLQRVEQCILHMDISSLDFNQVVRLCRENGLYGALIYLFNKGLDDFKTPLEELLSVLKNHERDVAVVGYRMLVYLKYCFSGLAFPPGHGTIPSQRLSSLRTELVQLLLEDSGGPKPQTSASLTSTGAYLNLYYLLELDTEASLDVLRIAFTEDDKFEALNSLLHSSDAAIDNNKENDSTPEDNNLMVQKTVDALALVLDVNISQTAASDGIYDTSIETWPSKNDIGHLIEFIACFIASKRAIVSKRVLSQILEFLISENYLSNSEQMNESKKVREKKVLALLDAVPQTEWNASYVLHLCEKAQFYQVCGLIHTSKCNYLAALDSYMKDMEEPVHTFSFIDGLLLKLSEAEANAFRSAVISRIPELVILNREWTFFLTSNHFNKENGLVLSELRTSSRSLFLYLKTLVEAHSSGTINFSKVSVDDVLDGPWGRQKKDEKSCLETFLERVSGFPKIIHDNPLEVTDDMIELYLEMLCQNEPDAVLKFLETCENYRVDRCLQLCQEYRIVDAAAFLLERVGDVGSALLLILSDLNSKFTMLDTAVGRMVANMGESKNDVVDYTLHASRLTEVQDIERILPACIGLCQRNSSRLESGETESLWFHLLDTFCKPFLKSQGNSENGVFAQSSSFKNDPERDATTWKVCGAGRYALVVKKLFSQFVKEIVEGMIGFVRLPSIMSKLLSDNGGQEFGDFKPTILGMLGTYGFEMRILDTAKCLIEDDAFYTMSALRKGASKGYAPRSLLCCICNCSFSKSPSSSGIRMFNCGHATHLQCELQESGTSSQSSFSGCPICVIKKKSRKAKGKAVEQGLVSTSSHRSWRTQGTTALQPHEFDALEHSAGSHPISRFEMLSSLQNKKVVQADTMPQLRLAPPAVYHEKVNKRNQYSAGGSSGSQQSKIRQLQDLKVKGSSNRFQLKSKIFGKEKTRVK